MRDTVVVRRPVGVSEPDPVTGAVTPVYDPTPVYEGKCRVKQSQAMVRTAESGGSTVVVQSQALHVPWSAPALLPGDVAVMDAATRTPRLRGLTYRVTGAHVGSDTTAQRVPVELLPGL